MIETRGIWQNKTELALAKIGDGLLISIFNFSPCLSKILLRQVTPYFPDSPAPLDTHSQFALLSRLSPSTKH